MSDTTELRQAIRAHEECHSKLEDTNKAWLAAESDCIRLEQAIRRALETMEDENMPFGERHYYGKRKLYAALASVRRTGP